MQLLVSLKLFQNKKLLKTTLREYPPIRPKKEKESDHVTLLLKASSGLLCPPEEKPKSPPWTTGPGALWLVPHPCHLRSVSCLSSDSGRSCLCPPQDSQPGPVAPSHTQSRQDSQPRPLQPQGLFLTSFLSLLQFHHLWESLWVSLPETEAPSPCVPYLPSGACCLILEAVCLLSSPHSTWLMGSKAFDLLFILGTAISTQEPLTFLMME